MKNWDDRVCSEGSEPQRPDPSAVTGADDPDGGEKKKAIGKAMQLLLYRQRSEKELREKLLGKGFSVKAEEAAVAYVRSFGYLDDRRYAEVYLHSNQGKKSRAVIRRELQAKGIASEWIELAFEEIPEEEGEVIFTLLCRRAGEPHRLEEKELRRQVAYLMRKGFSTSDIWKQVRRYQEQEKT